MDALLLYDPECLAALREAVQNRLAAAGFSLESTALDRQRIRPCAGCFKCWINTPGECHLTRDGVNALSTRFTNASIVIVLTRVTWGSYSADTKAFIDRCIPHISPFFSIIQGEMHHAPRYRHYPNWLIIGYNARSPEIQETFHQLVQRNAINFFAQNATSLCLAGVDLNEQDDARFGQALRATS